MKKRSYLIIILVLIVSACISLVQIKVQQKKLNLSLNNLSHEWYVKETGEKMNLIVTREKFQVTSKDYSLQESVEIKKIRKEKIKNFLGNSTKYLIDAENENTFVIYVPYEKDTSYIQLYRVENGHEQLLMTLDVLNQ